MYGALSYVWGEPEVTEDIVVSVNVFAATVNLASALRTLDSAGQDRFRLL
jgi:hypothetical protein